jgi:hypothetical protein
VERFHRRAAVFSADLSAESPDQTAYRALLEGLGYASNRSVFRLLADAVPYGWLMDVPLHRRGAVLLDAAGLGPQATPSPPAHVPREAWRLSRLRPANHPALRLRGLALLLERFQPSLADALVRLVHATERPSELRARLVARDGDTCIGPGRGDELAVSVVLPLVSALEDPADSAERLFLRYPSPPFNRWTRFMLDLAREAGHDGLRVRHADDHQGLHHLYHGHCRRGVSAGCPLCGLTRRAPLAAPEALTQAGHRTLDD